MAFLVGFLLLTGAMILQSSVLSQVQLLEGTIDLVFLCMISWVMSGTARKKQIPGAWQWALIAGGLVGYVSAVPFWAPIIAYLIVVGWCLILRSRVWQVPLLALLVATFSGSLIYQLIIYLALQATGVSLALVDAFNLIILPGVLLNLLGVIPISGFVGEIANMVYPADPDEA